MASVRVDQKARGHCQHRVLRILQGAGEGGPLPRWPSQLLGALKPWWDPPGCVEALTGSGDKDVTLSSRNQASVVHSTAKAKPQGSSRWFCHCVPHFLFWQNRDKASPPVCGAMSHSIPWGTREWSKAAWGWGWGCGSKMQEPSRALGSEPAPHVVSLSNWESIPTTLGLGGQRGQSQDALIAQIPDHSLHPQGQAGGQGPSEGSWGSW